MCSEYTNSTGECNELHSGVLWVATHAHQLILCLFTFIPMYTQCGSWGVDYQVWVPGSALSSVGPGECIIKLYSTSCRQCVYPTTIPDKIISLHIVQ